MRILVINPEYPPVGGGAGNASANISRCLAALGHEVHVLTAQFGSLPRREEAEGVRIHRVPALRRKPDRSGALEQLAFVLSGSGHALRLAREIRPQAALAFFGMPSGAAAWVLRRLYGIPYIVSLRGGDVPGFRPYDFKTYHRMIGPLLRVIWHGAARVIANSRGLHALAAAFDPDLDIPIIPNGVDAGAFDPGERDWSAPQILSAGRVVHQKGLDLGLQALAGLKDMDWVWRIAGDGPQMNALKELARELGIAERVHFLGWQSHQDLGKWYHRSNLFLFPSRHEGMPNAVLEAMASGLPVAATRIAGSEELVLDGVTGVLVGPEDAGALRTALRRLLPDGRLRAEMGRAARRRVETEYTWENTARRYVEHLERALQEK